MPSSALTRRGLLLGSVGSLALVSCTSPTVRGPHDGATPVAPPTPDTALVQARTDEGGLVALLGAAVAATGTLTPAQVTTVKQLLAAHTAHLVVLGRTDPLQAGATPEPTAATSPATAKSADWAALAAQIAALEKTAQQHHRAAALAATDGPMALLYASLATFAGLNTTPGRAISAGKTTPARVEVGSRPEALQVLLSRLRALAEGLEIGIGQLPNQDKAIAPGKLRLAAVWTQRDQTEQALRAAKGEVPPAELNYQMPGGFGSPAQIATTWRALESAVFAAWARLTAASTGKERAAALDAMAAQAVVAHPAGSPVSHWPGWV
ncbi:DUF4439 domain-containing protein [Luteococcus sp. H138]|uniref:DUF4439 domain-containing protein n=1 Tax=unclassified Luteococcus TaxID=2639923 RepID=UPI00313DD878